MRNISYFTSNKYFFTILLILTIMLFLNNHAFGLNIIEEIIEGNIIIDTDSNLLWIIKGDVTVAPGVFFQVDGIVEGNVTLEIGSTLLLNGIIGGNIININNLGNIQEINGILKGSIITE